MIEAEAWVLQLLTLKVEKGSTSQGMQVASASWKNQENEFSLRASAILSTLWLDLVEPFSDVWPLEV